MTARMDGWMIGSMDSISTSIVQKVGLKLRRAGTHIQKKKKVAVRF